MEHPGAKYKPYITLPDTYDVLNESQSPSDYMLPQRYDLYAYDNDEDDNDKRDEKSIEQVKCINSNKYRIDEMEHKEQKKPQHGQRVLHWSTEFQVRAWIEHLAYDLLLMLWSLFEIDWHCKRKGRGPI